jgi:hypothetical protein
MVCCIVIPGFCRRGLKGIIPKLHSNQDIQAFKPIEEGYQIRGYHICIELE